MEDLVLNSMRTGTCTSRPVFFLFPSPCSSSRPARRFLYPSALDLEPGLDDKQSGGGFKESKAHNPADIVIGRAGLESKLTGPLTRACPEVTGSERNPEKALRNADIEKLSVFVANGRMDRKLHESVD
ncbi:hypothetical protein CPAR01_09766 [Colletotrichum paranaense]|uniref:Uncharacterized protein n=1 Tax=Colletotrichum paranaense TaxID=1914294 RepID=A0ABQ9SHP5_9PEZI|nr:uncharacterized protein CPAR01_09766 [Colletotrichum paranaense]KAK1536224.1 hypothetical protein CPAR01_09766 [Colletotrichum paranaense]